MKQSQTRTNKNYLAAFFNHVYANTFTDGSKGKAFDVMFSYLDIDYSPPKANNVYFAYADCYPEDCWPLIPDHISHDHYRTLFSDIDYEDISLKLYDPGDPDPGCLSGDTAYDLFIIPGQE